MGDQVGAGSNTSDPAPPIVVLLIVMSGETMPPAASDASGV
jgi:hypothetical protein